MNSTNKQLEYWVDELGVLFSCQIGAVSQNQLACDFHPNEIHGALAHLKANGWKQLSLLTCVDWIKENQFQLVYIVRNWDNGITVQVRTRIDRDQAEFRTVTSIYPGALFYEREVHEFFGVSFAGNDTAQKPLFLEIWDDMPPLRKDFDPLAYSKRKYPEREHLSGTEKAGELE